MHTIYIMEYYATIKDHILEKYILAWENAPSILSKKQITEHNHNFMNYVCIKFIEEIDPNATAFWVMLIFKVLFKLFHVIDFTTNMYYFL